MKHNHQLCQSECFSELIICLRPSEHMCGLEPPHSSVDTFFLSTVTLFISFWRCLWSKATISVRRKTCIRVGPLYSLFSICLSQTEPLPSPAAKYLRSTVTILTCHSIRYALFWDVMYRRMVIPYWRFGTRYRSHLQESRSLSSCTPSCTSWPLNMGLIVCPETSARRYHSARRLGVISQKSADLVCSAAEAWNLSKYVCLCSTAATLFVGIYFHYTEWREWKKLKTKVGFSEFSTVNSKGG